MAVRPVSNRLRPQRLPRPPAELAWSPRVRLLRPDDLLVLWLSWHDLDLVPAEDGRVLRAGANGGLLRVDWSFQHIAEQASLLAAGAKPTDPPVEPYPAIPTPARAANPSRLVFRVPAGEAIPYSIAGVLAAMSRLQLNVAPAAIPQGDLLPAGIDRPLMVPSLLDLARDLGATLVSHVLEAQRTLLASRRIGAMTDVLVTPGRDFAAVRPPVFRPGRPRLPEIRSPAGGETAIEAPFRLILSPQTEASWVHAPLPVADGGGKRIELWHSRMAVRTDAGVTEAPNPLRVVRAIWTRDTDMPFKSDPFPHSLRWDQREAIVSQSVGTAQVPRARPRPITVHRLALSSAGAWLDLDVQWDWEQYQQAFTPLASWTHVAPMGRDQYVRVVTPGYLYPLGQRAYLVQVSYRKIVGDANPQAALFQKFYITLGDPLQRHSRRDFPFVTTQLSPGRTPDLALPGNPQSLKWFFPQAIGASEPFAWKIAASDHDGNAIFLETPLLFVFVGPDVDPAKIASDYAAKNLTIAGKGQTVAFAPALAPGEGAPEARASAELVGLRLSGVAATATSEAFLAEADIVIPAVKSLTPAAPTTTVLYPDVYKTAGFGAANAGNVFLALKAKQTLDFGSSNRSGGFIKPDIAIGGLARSTGLVSDITSAAAGTFKAADLFSAGFPKLFGLINLADLVLNDVLDHAPRFITEALDKVSAMVADVQALKAACERYGEAPALPAHVDTLVAAIAALPTAGAAGPGAVQNAITTLAGEVKTLADALPGKPLDPMARAMLSRLTTALQPVLMAADWAKTLTDFTHGLDPGGGQFRARMEWHPRLQNWPAGKPVFEMKDPDTALSLSVEVRTTGPVPSGAEVAAELRDFQLNLLPGFELMKVKFQRIAFVASAARRPEIDVVFDELEFVGVLSFVEVLKTMIPLDGFSDPPFLDVSTDGISAGFTMALPNVAIGVFSLTNIALGADVRVPFLGDVVSVGFNFCTRERPFTLAVAFLGGGGFLGMRLSPQGLVLLEGAFEFGAVVALDFGVASGSVSVMAGIYFRIESKEGQLTGYLRIRGEVDVLSLITASLELYLALEYFTASDKLVGEASLKIKIEILFLSTSVTVKARRTFAGSNGDPTVHDMLRVENGQSGIWDEYLAAFAASAEA